MSSISEINLKVLVMDTDFYALSAINGFLAWDRRTRVTNLSESVQQMWDYIERTSLAELPDVVLLDADHLGGPAELRRTIEKLRRYVEGVRVICMAQQVDPELVETAAETRAYGYLLKQAVRLQVAWAIVYSLSHDFIITHDVRKLCAHLSNRRVLNASILPEMKKFPELTERIRQAIKLCVVEGMPAHLAADEMGISLHTIRGYIKEGYRILEAYDETEYPVDMTPQERAFMRFTAFEQDRDQNRPYLEAN